MHDCRRSPELSPARGRDTLLHGALGAAAVSVMALAAARIFHTFSFHEPLQLVTSGAEEEALASVWRLAHGQVLYTDPHAVPFTASYFNWLFYGLYALAAGAAHRLGLSDPWLPTVCRWLTLGLAGAGVALLFCALRRATARAVPTAVCLALALLAFFNPLAGFWVVTTRPDVAAAVFELAGVAAALAHVRTSSRRALVLAALAFVAAWACKQTAVGACAGVSLGLWFARRSITPLALLPPIAVALSALVSCALLGPIYRHGLYGSQLHSGFHLTWAFLHFGAALLKMPFMAVALATAVLARRRAFADPALRLVGCVLGAVFAVDLVGACKGGAGDYYFLPLGVISMLWLGLALAHLPGRGLRITSTLAAAAQIIVVGAVLSGSVGTVDPRDPARPYEHLAAYLAMRPGPVFVRDTYGDLPWISPTSPHFVIGYNNEADQDAGVPMAEGGWRGLVARGYFTTVVAKAARPGMDDALLAHYRRVRREAGWVFYERAWLFSRHEGAAAGTSCRLLKPTPATCPEKSRAAFR